MVRTTLRRVFPNRGVQPFRSRRRRRQRIQPGRRGLTGRTSLGLLFIDLFFIPANLRRDGLGSRLLRLAEDEARRRGCVNAVLYTINFQAPAFYERHGYRILGSVPCLPLGTSRIFMTKPLT